MNSEFLVYTSTKIHPAILRVINDEVEQGNYENKNDAINKGLAKAFKVKLPKQIFLKDLLPGEKFKFATNTAYKVYRVKENCKLDKKNKIKNRKRKCEEIESGKLIYPDCSREVIKIE